MARQRLVLWRVVTLSSDLQDFFIKSDAANPSRAASDGYTSRRLPNSAGKAPSGFKERQQVGVELVFVCFREAVGCARKDL